MIVSGKIREIFPEKQIKETFKKREFVIDYLPESNYPQLIKFELVNEGCSLINGYSIGDEVEVVFELTGREWINPEGERIYFTTLRALKISRLEKESNEKLSESLSTSENSFGNDDIIPSPKGEDEDNDLPF